MGVVHKTVNHTLTEAEILTLSNQPIGASFIATDTEKVFGVDMDGNIIEDVNREIIYVENVNNNSDQVLEVTEENNIHNLSGRKSYSNLGASTGRHYYIFSGQKHTVDLFNPDTINAQLVDGNNTTIENINSFYKDITGNSWNSSAYSTNGYDCDQIDFACTWEVESITGTIREMAGLDSSPSGTVSYTGIDFAIYQVNANVYVYENGSNRGSNLLPFSMAVGDRLGVKIIENKVYYFHLRGNVETVFYESNNPARGMYYFDSSLNRGSSSSGAARVDNVVFHTAQKSKTFSVEIQGLATTTVQQEKIDELFVTAGMIIEESSTYDNLNFTRVNTLKFNFPLDITYNYYPATPSVLTTINP